jgi:hypothetical protein
MALAIVPGQINKGASNANVTSFNTTLASGTTAGNLVVAIVDYGNNGTITKPANWVQAAGPQLNGTTQTGGIFYLPNCPGGATSYAWTLGTSGGVSWFIYEVSGADTVSPFDQKANTSGTSTAWVSGTTPTTTLANEIVFAGVCFNSGSAQTISGLTAGYTDDGMVHCSGATNNPNIDGIHQIISATGAQSASCTISASVGWIGVIATFKQAPVVVTTIPISAHAQWPNPVRIMQRPGGLAPMNPRITAYGPSNATTLTTAEMFFGEVAPIPSDTPVVSKNYGAWPNGPLRTTQRQSMLWAAHLAADTVSGGISENDLTAGNVSLFYGLVDQQATVIGAATGQFSTADAALSDGAASAQETFTATASPQTIVPGTATGQFTYSANALSNGMASSQETFSASASPSTIVPASATGTFTFSSGALSNGMAAAQQTFGPAALSNGMASSLETFSATATPVLTGGNLIVASATGQFTYTAQLLSNGMAQMLATFSAQATGVLVSGQLLTPVGAIVARVSPTGAITAGTVLSGTIAGGLQPGGIIQAGTAPQGTIVPGTKPDGTIVRD